MGNNMAMVAKLEVISVRKFTAVITIKRIMNIEYIKENNDDIQSKCLIVRQVLQNRTWIIKYKQIFLFNK